MDADIQYPSSFEEVVQLVMRFYQPGTPATINKIQEILQQVQRSPDGWKLADALLGTPDQQVQFFGALTFTVKLNSDWESLAEADIIVLLETLINWVIRFVSQGAAPLVIKKLCSTLAVFFLRFPDKWTNCIRHLICCLCDHMIGPDAIDNCPPTGELIKKANTNQKTVALWFSAIFLEEVSKIDVRNIKNAHFRDKVDVNVDEVIILIQDAISIPAEGLMGHDISLDTRLVSEGLKCFSSWAQHSMRNFAVPAPATDKLKSLNVSVMNWLQHAETFDTTAEFISDALTNYGSFFRDADIQALFQILTSTWAVTKFQQILSGEDDMDAISFTRLVISFAENNAKSIAHRPQDVQTVVLLQMMHGMLAAPGYPVVEDEISPQTFEFWSCIVELLLDPEAMQEAMQEAGDPNFAGAMEEGRRHVFQAIQEYWAKIKIPPASVAETWNKEAKEGFQSYRKDFQDLLETAYPLLNYPLFTKFVGHIINGLSAPDWEDIEASMFCLLALADSLTDEPSEDDALEELFGSPLFTLLSASQANIPLRARRTAVSLIGSYADFFERNAEFLPAVLNYLFTTLSASSLARPASKSISQLCSSCRDTLTPEISTFLYQYELFTSSPAADELAKERVVCAISYVIQALPTEEEKAAPIVSLLGLIQKDVESCLALVQQGQFDVARDVALLVLRCLANMGRGLQVPDDIPILLDADKNPLRAVSFWEQEKGATIQTQVVQMIQALVIAMHEDPEVVDAACSIFKTGFTEVNPGAFVFQANVTANFLLERAANSRRVETIVSTAATMISSHSTSGTASIAPQARSLLDMVAALAEKYQDPQSDPDVAQSIVEFLNRLLQKYVDVLVGYEPKSRMEFLFFFALNSLSVREPLVKKAACAFWGTFVSIKEDKAELQTEINSIVQACGPALAEKLVWGIGGGAARSEIDGLCDTLKKLVFKQAKAKAWLSAAVARPGYPSPKISDIQKRLFVEKVVRLRGDRNTNQVCRDFWVSCRGNEFAYASAQFD